MHPGRAAAGLGHPPRKQAGKAILPRLVDHHVGALGMAVGEVGPLSGFEVEPPPSPPGVGVTEHLVERDVEGGVGGIAAGNALKPDPRASRRGGVDLGLNVDMGEHAVRHEIREPEHLEDLAERVRDRRHALRFARHRIRAQDDVSNAVGPAVEYLPADVVGMIGGRVWLEPRREAAATADPRPRQRVVDGVADADQLLVGQQPHDTSDHVARQPWHDRLDRRFGLSEEKPPQRTERPVGDPALDGRIEIGRERRREPIGEGGMGVDLPQGRPGQQAAGPFPLRLVGRGHADDLISFFEGVGLPQQPGVDRLIPAAGDPVNVRDEVVCFKDCGGSASDGGHRRCSGHAGEKGTASKTGHEPASLCW